MKKKEGISVQNAEGAGPGVDQEVGSTGDEETEDTVKILAAVYPILYLSHQYNVGDELPANDPGMVEAWLCAGTAAWIQLVPKSPMAKLRTAEPGLPGRTVSSEFEDGDNLAGKVPKTSARKR